MCGTSTHRLPRPPRHRAPRRLQAGSLTPQVVNHLAKQIRALAGSPPEGITFLPGESLTELFAVIVGPGACACARACTRPHTERGPLCRHVCWRVGGMRP